MDRKLGGVAVLALAGCASMGGASFEQLDQALSRQLMNRPAAEAIAYFGPPARMVDKGTFTEYQWDASALLRSRSTTTSTATGTVGGVIPYAERTESTTTTPVDLACQLRIGVQNGIIGGYGYTGDWGACRPFYNRLTGG